MTYIISYLFISLVCLIKSQLNLKFFKAVCTVIIFIALLTIASGRANNIGTDISYYVELVFNNSKQYYSFQEFLYSHQLEFGYDYLSFLCSRMTNDIHVVFLINHFFILFFVFCAINFFSRDYKISSSFCLLLYIFSFYNYSLNIVRQSIAVSILFFFMFFLFKKNYLIFLIGTFFSVLFHDSGIVGLFIFILFVIYNFIKTFKYKRYLIVLFLLGTFIVILFSPMFITFFVSIGILPERFEEHFYSYQTQTNGVLFIFSQFPILFLSIYSIAKNKIDERLSFLYYFPVFSFSFSICGLYFGFAGRLLYYFQIFNIILYPLIQSKFYNQKNKVILNAVYFLWIIFLWFYCYFICNWGETIPYEWGWNI